MSSKEDYIFIWPEATQYFARSYAPMSKISSVMANIQEFSRELMETGRVLTSKLYQILCHCGNGHTPEQVPNLYIDTLHPQFA